MGVSIGVHRRGRPGPASAANIFKDGLQIEAFFFAFILVLTIVIARTFPGRYRLLALIPAGTVAAIFLFVFADGPILLVTWLAAATAAVLTSGRAPMRAPPTTPESGAIGSPSH